MSEGTVGKAMSVLDLVASKGRPVRLVEVQDEAEYPKATLYRLLQSLVKEGLLTFSPERQTYALGLRLVRLAHSAWSQSSLGPVARPVIEALAAKVGETVHLAQLDQGQVLYVDKRNALRPIEMFSQAGKVGPAYCTGVGKAMLAFLGEAELEAALKRQAFYQHTRSTLMGTEALRAELAAIRAAGVAYDREEHEAGIICIAVPILTRAGRVIGGLSVTSSVQRHSLEALEVFREPLIEAAAMIAQDAEAWLFPA